MNRIDGQIRLFRSTSRTEGKSNKGSTTQVTTANSDGVITVNTGKITIERMIAKVNDQNGHQIEGDSQLLTPIFTSKLRAYGKVAFISKFSIEHMYYLWVVAHQLETLSSHVIYSRILRISALILTYTEDLVILRKYGTLEENQHAHITNTWGVIEPQ